MLAIWLNRNGRAWPVDLPVIPDAEARTLVEAVDLVGASKARTLERYAQGREP